MSDELDTLLFLIERTGFQLFLGYDSMCIVNKARVLSGPFKFLPGTDRVEAARSFLSVGIGQFTEADAATMQREIDACGEVAE